MVRIYTNEDRTYSFHAHVSLNGLVMTHNCTCRWTCCYGISCYIYITFKSLHYKRWV